MQLKEGDQFKQTVINNMDIQMEVMGQKQNMKITMDAGTFFEVLKSSATGADLKMTYTSMKSTTDFGENKSALSDSAMKSRMDKLIGKSIILHLNKNNQVDSVTHSYELLLTDTLSPEMQAMFRQVFSKEQMNNTFGFMFSMYPDKPVRIGETWKKELVMNIAGIEMNTLVNYSLKSVNNNNAQVDVTGSFLGNGKLPQMPTVEIKMDGTQDGSLHINMQTGYLIKGNYNMDIKAGAESSGMKMNMVMKGDIKITGE